MSSRLRKAFSLRQGYGGQDVAAMFYGFPNRNALGRATAKRRRPARPGWRVRWEARTDGTHGLVRLMGRERKGNHMGWHIHGTAQIRRGEVIGEMPPAARRDFRPTGSGGNATC